jgi:hypothetical protein
MGRIASIMLALTSRARAKSGVAALLSLPGMLMLEFVLTVKLKIANELKRGRPVSSYFIV